MSETLVNLPGTENIEGDYFITGTVTQRELEYILEIRLHASCSKKVLESTQVRFAKSSDQSAFINAAQLAAGKFLDLGTLIRASGLHDRNEGTGTDISAVYSSPIEIKLSKNVHKAGEKTEVILALKDCD